MTSYTLSPGYQSGGSRDDAWRELKASVTAIRRDADALVAEVQRVDPGHFDPDTLREYAASYVGDEDLTLTIYEAKGDDDQPCIRQLASGGGEGRCIKEAMRRAFCRLVIESMHRKGVEVNLVVA